MVTRSARHHFAYPASPSKRTRLDLFRVVVTRILQDVKDLKTNENSIKTGLGLACPFALLD